MRLWPIVTVFLGACATAPAPPQVSAPPAPPSRFYVSAGGDDANDGTTEARPFRTIERARDAVRAVNNATPTSDEITVFLRGGVHQLTSTLVFDQRDSGKGFPVIYQSFPGEAAIISGGRRITGWTREDGGVYKAPVGPLRTRQLYVNGAPAIRARTPNAGSFYRLRYWDHATRTIVVNAGEVAKWAHLPAVEMIVHREWTQHNMRIASIAITDDRAAITPLEPDRTRGFGGHTEHHQNDQTYYFENARELLDSDGEWYLDTASQEIFYKPLPGQDMAGAVVVAPVLERLLLVKGTPDRPVHDLRFAGLTFEGSSWILPSEEGFANGQADSIGSKKQGLIPAAIHVQHAHHLRFERNLVRNLGGMGLVLFAGTHDNLIAGNVFRNIAASGIGVALSLDRNPKDPRDVCRRDVIQNNLVTRVARDYHGSVGIFAGYTEGLIIEHNELVDLPYTGISVGWGWTGNDTALKNNVIGNNRIHDVVNLISDGGGIYTLSKQPGTKILRNYVYDIVKSTWAGRAFTSGIYLDEQSNFFTVEDNVVENVAIGLFLHKVANATVVNFQGTVEDYTPEKNRLMNRGTIDRAAIKAAAGIEPAYRDVIKELLARP